ncbi:hypothetical protein D3C78_1095700 [compost metagenome]
MRQRAFSNHIAWSAAQLKGDRALAYVAIRSTDPGAKVIYHQVFIKNFFASVDEAYSAADEAVSRIITIDARSNPIFSFSDH